MPWHHRHGHWSWTYNSPFWNILRVIWSRSVTTVIIRNLIRIIWLSRSGLSITRNVNLVIITLRTRNNISPIISHRLAVSLVLFIQGLPLVLLQMVLDIIACWLVQFRLVQLLGTFSIMNKISIIKFNRIMIQIRTRIYELRWQSNMWWHRHRRQRHGYGYGWRRSFL